MHSEQVAKVRIAAYKKVVSEKMSVFLMQMKLGTACADRCGELLNPKNQSLCQRSKLNP